MVINNKEIDEIFQKIIEKTEQRDYVCEGLIKSYSLLDTQSFLRKFFSHPSYGLSIKIFNNDKIAVSFGTCATGLNENVLEYLITCANTCGYYPTLFITKDAMNKQIKFELDVAKTQLVRNNIYVILFSPRFQLPLDVEDIPSILFHVSSVKYEEKIMSIGFVPKTKNKFENHPARVYFANSAESIKILLKHDKFINDSVDEYVIFKLDVKKLLIDRPEISFYTDNSFKNRGYYTMDNISPKYLEVIHRIKLKT